MLLNSRPSPAGIVLYSGRTRRLDDELVQPRLFQSIRVGYCPHQHPSGPRQWSDPQRNHPREKDLSPRPSQDYLPHKLCSHAASKIIGSQIHWFTLSGPTPIAAHSGGLYFNKSAPSYLDHGRRQRLITSHVSKPTATKAHCRAQHVHLLTEGLGDIKDHLIFHDVITARHSLRDRFDREHFMAVGFISSIKF